MPIRLRTRFRFVERYELAAFNDTGAAERTRVALIEVRSDRPIWGFACHDHYGASDYGFDESRPVLLLDELNQESVREAIRGRSVFQHRTGEGDPPRVERIAMDRDAETITVEAADCERIEWIADGGVRGTGEMFSYIDQSVFYTRTQLENNDGMTGTQSFRSD